MKNKTKVNQLTIDSFKTQMSTVFYTQIIMVIINIFIAFVLESEFENVFLKFVIALFLQIAVFSLIFIMSYKGIDKMLMISALIEDGQYKKALDLIEKIRISEKTSTENLLKSYKYEGDVYKKQQKLDIAKITYEKALKNGNKELIFNWSWEVYYAIAQIYKSTEDHYSISAAEYLEKVYHHRTLYEFETEKFNLETVIQIVEIYEYRESTKYKVDLWLSRELTLREKLLKPSVREAAKKYEEEGDIEAADKNLEAALAKYQKALDILVPELKKDNIYLTSIYIKILEIYDPNEINIEVHKKHNRIVANLINMRKMHSESENNDDAKLLNLQKECFENLLPKYGIFIINFNNYLKNSYKIILFSVEKNTTLFADYNAFTEKVRIMQESCNTAISIIQQQNLSEENLIKLAGFYCGLGDSYLFFDLSEDTEKSRYYYDLALQCLEKLGENNRYSEDIAGIYYNITNSFSTVGNFEEAKKLLIKSMKLLPKNRKNPDTFNFVISALNDFFEITNKDPACDFNMFLRKNGISPITDKKLAEAKEYYKERDYLSQVKKIKNGRKNIIQNELIAKYREESKSVIQNTRSYQNEILMSSKEKAINPQNELNDLTIKLDKLAEKYTNLIDDEEHNNYLDKQNV
ncbi:MAG: hypothetical protein LBM93_00880 [Oscillospiraceae bacterium]|nr:hypothetical protein [Oscillospiraceae bacterium]